MFLSFFFLKSAIFWALSCDLATARVIQIIGATKNKQYTIKYGIVQFSATCQSFNNHNITIYGHIVQGNKNTVSTNHIKNAEIGEVTFDISCFILGLRETGTSITKTFLYQK